MEKQVLIADEHSIVRKGLRLLIESQFGKIKIDDAENCGQIMSALKGKNYSHLILDFIFPDGNALEILPPIRRLYPDLRIVIFTGQPENIYKKALLSLGIQSYVLKSSKEEDVIRGLRKYFEADPKSLPLNHIDKSSPLMDLTVRELEVAHYLLKGKGPTEIGNALNLTKSTVSTLKLRIFKKSNVENVMELKELMSTYKMSSLARKNDKK